MKKVIFTLWVLIIIFIPCYTVFANPIPSPTATYNILQNNQKLIEPIFFSTLPSDATDLTKYKADLIDSTRKNNFTYNKCQDSVCTDFFPSEKPAKLLLYLLNSGLFFLTNDFEPDFGFATYKIDLLTNGTANIQKTSSTPIHNYTIKVSPVNFALPLLILLLYIILAIGLELLIVKIIFGQEPLNKRKLYLAIIIANLISYPIFYFLLYQLNTYPSFQFFWIIIIISEIAIILFEALIIYLINIKEFKYKRALKISAVMNVFSLVISIIITVILGFLI